MAAHHRLFDRVVPLIVAAILVVPITYLEVVHPSWQQVSSTISTLTQGRVSVQPQSTSAKVNRRTTSSSATAQPAVPAKTALTTSFVHLRSAKSVSSTIITDLNAGTTVQLRDDADATWQGVTYKGKNGYIYRSYLQY